MSMTIAPGCHADPRVAPPDPWGGRCPGARGGTVRRARPDPDRWSWPGRRPRRRLDGGEDPLSDQRRHGRIDLLADRDELIAAVPGDRVAGADRAAQPPGNLDEHRIADDVTVAIVDRLELVEVDEQDRSGARVPGRVGDRVAQAIVQQRPVGEARERVMDGVVARLLLTAQSLKRGRQRVDESAGVTELLVGEQALGTEIQRVPGADRHAQQGTGQRAGRREHDLAPRAHLGAGDRQRLGQQLDRL
jgi:hypothetical protein